MSPNDIMTENNALFNIGFRPFFLGAAIFSIITVALWMAIYVFHTPVPIHHISISQWHAHEMIYGYALAVISGFLLTAVRNWTGIQTLSGLWLLILFSLWITARILFLFGTLFVPIAVGFDLLFNLWLVVAIAIPIIQSKSWLQLAILAKLVLITAGNVCFYLGYFGYLTEGIFWGIYGGLFLIISLILTIGRRVIPFFIERGVGYPVQLYNSKWIDLSSLVLFLCFFIAELFIKNDFLSGGIAAIMFCIITVRLVGWHTPGIWQKPLLWSLYLALLFIDVGFLLFALSHFSETPVFIAIHAFAYGGIGMMTMSMMARVALGHTGRNVHTPPKTVSLFLSLLVIGTICRLVFPLVDISHYKLWIFLSQGLWILAFSLFTISYSPILIRPRIDGQPE